MNIAETSIHHYRFLPEEIAAAAWIESGSIAAAITNLVPEPLRASAAQIGLRSLFARNLVIAGQNTDGRVTMTLDPELQPLVRALATPGSGTRMQITTAEMAVNVVLFESEHGCCSLTPDLLGTIDVLFGPAGSADALRSMLLPKKRFHASTRRAAEAAIAGIESAPPGQVVVLCEDVSVDGAHESRSFVGSLT
jgi:hypothetical protein